MKTLVDFCNRPESYYLDGNRVLIHSVMVRVTTLKKSKESFFEVGYLQHGVRYFEIPQGFMFDGASIPKFAWSIIGSPFTGKYYNAGLMHDYFYRTGIVTKKEADELFYVKMRQDGVGYIKANLMFAAVKMFGGFSYKGEK